MANPNKESSVIVDRCMQVINNNPSGVLWSHLVNRILVLKEVGTRKRTQVFTLLKQHTELCNNDADDMSDTLFTLKKWVSPPDTNETSSTEVSSAPLTPKAERLSRYQSLGSKVTPIKKEPVMTVVTGEPRAHTKEDDLLAEMAWQICRTGDVGMTVNSLLKSVPELAECDPRERYQLIGELRERFQIGYYVKDIGDDRTVKVMRARPTTRHVTRPAMFVAMGRPLHELEAYETQGKVSDMVASFGHVPNIALGGQLQQLNISQWMKNNLNTQEQQDAEDDYLLEALEMDEPIMPDPLIKSAYELTKPAAFEPPRLVEPVAKPAEAVPPIAETPTVLSEEVTQAADTLRLIASQLEAQAGYSEAVSRAKGKFDSLLKAARVSAEEVKAALTKHDSMLDQLQQAADDLASL